MVIIKLACGMGNQMFQYALYQAFLEKGIEAKLDISKFSHFDEHRECFLNYDCFDLKYDLCTKKESKKFVLGTGMLDRVIIRLFGDRDTHVFEKDEFKYDSSILDLDNVFIDGYWQTHKYFEHISDKIRECYTFKNTLTGRSGEYLKQIQTTNSVAVHIRRGDYVRLSNLYGDICTEEYYDKAMDMILVRQKDAQFFFFSNDMEWTKEHFGKQDNFHYVEGNDEKKGYIDLQLMTACKHQIVANSSFSWWAAWLNNNKSKIVIAPDKWIQTKDTPDIYFEEMIRISTKN